MPGTFTQLLIHVVFSTKNRRPMITDEISSRLYPYLGGILRNHGSQLLCVGGVEDHVHLLVKLKPDICLSDMMRETKARSSAWVHDVFPAMQEFAWQEGYGAFSVSQSNVDAVREYIANQAEHHRAFDFQKELIRLLDRHQIEYDPRYIFD